jgi:16S rRNA (uracil1498-N3)-methyltransferase
VVERSGNAAVTTFLVASVVGNGIRLGEEAAHHARVKRLEVGDAVSVTDGRGTRGSGRIGGIHKRELMIDVAEVIDIPQPAEINLFVPVGDKDRMLWVAEKATELQVTSWNPVLYERSKSVSSRGDGEAFERKVLARMIGALEQSGGAWLPTMNQVRTVDDLTRTKGLVMLQDSNPFGRWTTFSPVNVAVGPEGGFTSDERDRLLDAGWSAASLGDVTLRFETAAIGAVAVLRALMN